MKRIQTILAGAAVLTFASMDVSGAVSGGYSASNFSLELAGANTGMIKSFEGGAIGAPVLEEITGASQFAKKHIGNVKYEEIGVEASFSSMTKGFYNWISDSVDGVQARMDGAVVLSDQNFKRRSQMNFQEGLITEVTVPACDASGPKEPGTLKIKIKPELIKNEALSGGSIAMISKSKQKQWLTSNFRFSIPGVNCERVTKVESFSIKQKVAESNVGVERGIEIEPTRVEYPNLRLTIPAAFAGDFVKWHEDFVIKGNSMDKNEKQGSLSLLSVDLKEEIAKITFYNVGISRLEQKSKGEGLDCVIDLYVERMEIDFMAQFEK